MHGSEEDGLTQSDVQARRLLDIVLTLLGSPGPVSSGRMRELHYPDAQPESFRKLFSRDRQRLALCGIAIRRTNRPPDEPLWEIDRDRSFVKKGALDPREAVILDVACAQLAADPSFPLANDLRMALAKIDGLFDRRAPSAIELPPAKHNKRLATLESCVLACHAADIRYQRTDGSVVVRRLAPYGLFTLRGQTYVVGPTIDADRCGTSEPRTYRLSRILSITECKRITYVIPRDFDVHDYVLLPFQVGKHLYYANFVPLHGTTKSFARDNGLTTYVSHDENATVLHISVSDEFAAAAWAIEMELVPTSPASLVKAWEETLRSSIGAQEE